MVPPTTARLGLASFQMLHALPPAIRGEASHGSHRTLPRQPFHPPASVAYGVLTSAAKRFAPQHAKLLALMLPFRSPDSCLDLPPPPVQLPKLAKGNLDAGLAAITKEVMQNDPETRESLKRYEAAMVGPRANG